MSISRAPVTGEPALATTVATESTRVSEGVGPRCQQAENWLVGYRWAVRAIDALMVVIAVAVAQVVRFGAADADLGVRQWRVDYPVVGVVLAAAWWLGLTLLKTRERWVLGYGQVEYRRVLSATGLVFGAVAVVSYLTGFELARGYVAVAFPVGAGLLVLGRWLARLRLGVERRNGVGLTPTLVVGSSAEIGAIVRDLVSEPISGYAAAAVCPTDDGPSDPSWSRLPRVAYDDLVGSDFAAAGGAVLLGSSLSREQVKQLGWDLEGTNAQLMVTAALTDIAGPRVHLTPVGSSSMVHVDLPSFSGTAYAVKRVMDLTVASAALLVLSPVMLVVAVLVRAGDGGPVIFRQDRVGRDGQTFRMTKFRTMVPDAEQRLAEVSQLDKRDHVLFKLPSDPRVTPVGRVLRRYSLDELPQLWDVLRGEMSIVGPRPPLPHEVDQWSVHVHRRLLIKPGVTGLWQVSGRSRLSWEESVRLDLQYVENWSPTGDLVILARTVRAVLSRDGAY